MRVFIAGSTGVLGRRLVGLLAERGHDVVGLTRDGRGDELVREHGGTPVRGDVLDPDSLREGVAGADVVIHAATAIPTGRPRASDWARNDRVRREGTTNLTAAAVDAGVDRYLQQSVAWVARQPDGSPFDEESEPNPDRSTRSALDGERIARRAGEEHGFDVGVLRCGWFYAHDATHTREIGRRLHRRRMPLLGGGVLGRRDATISPIHADDAASAFVAAIEGEATGLWHVVDDEPISVSSFFHTFAALLDAPRPRRVPGWLLKPLLGGPTVDLLTISMPTSNDRFRTTFDWSPAYPTARVGLEQVVERWRSDESVGFVADAASGGEERGSGEDGSVASDEQEAT